MSAPVKMLEIDRVRKAFPGVLALDGVMLTLRPGEIHALVGENGAGKSTLIKVITGVYRPDDGRLLLDGNELTLRSPQDATRAGIGVVHQERNLIPRFSVAENVVLETLPSRAGFVDRRAMIREATVWLELLDLDVDPTIEVARLGPAQRQLVEIAKALATRSRILLLDEPTASITPNEANALFAVLRNLRAQGVAMLFVSHKLEEIRDLCDRITILRDGKTVATDRPLVEVSRNEIVSLMVGRSQVATSLPARGERSSAAILEVDRLATAIGHRDISFALHRNEILGLYGLVGAGRSELARALIGIEPVTGGTISVGGHVAVIDDVRAALRRYRLAYVTENRKEEGLFLVHSVATNIGVTVWDRLRRAVGWIANRSEATLAATYVERLGIRVASTRQVAGTLSGGNQQKVSLAKWLAAEVEILIIDEPTIGIDVRTKDAFHELIWQLAGTGTAILLISSDMPEMVKLADRILVMNDKRLVAEIANTREYTAMSQAIIAAIHDTEALSHAPG